MDGEWEDQFKDLSLTMAPASTGSASVADLSDRSGRREAARRARRGQGDVGLGLPASRRGVAGLAASTSTGARPPSRGTCGGRSSATTRRGSTTSRSVVFRVGGRGRREGGGAVAGTGQLPLPPPLRPRPPTLPPGCSKPSSLQHSKQSNTTEAAKGLGLAWMMWGSARRRGGRGEVGGRGADATRSSYASRLVRPPGLGNPGGQAGGPRGPWSATPLPPTSLRPPRRIY